MASLTFFFDRCFGTRLPRWLSGIKPPFEIEYHQAIGFKDTTPDDEWLAFAGDKKWTVLSHDKKFHKESMAILAVQQHNVRCFYLDAAQLPSWDKVVLIGRALPRIRDIGNRTTAPYIYRIAMNGRVYRVA